MSFAWSAYRVVAPWLGAMAPGVRWLASPAERPLWSERLGHVKSPAACDAWVHAASLGEALAVGPLLAEMRALTPAARFWLTAATRSGRARLEALHEPVSLAPLDAPQIVKRFYDGVKPRRLFLVETELWPHWLLRARLDQVPVAVLSARLSSRSLNEYRRLGSDFRALLGGLSGVIAQTEEDADRWLRLGAPRARTVVAGNLKNDALPVAAEDRGSSRIELGLDAGRPLLVLGNVRPGEARMLARAWAAQPEAIRKRWQVAAVPRHPRAAGDLRIEAREAYADAAGGGARDPWIWVDQLGVLARYYAVADAAFVGGSLLAYGGHNPLEPAACGAAVFMGPHFESQRSGVGELDVRRAIRIVDGPPQIAVAFRDVLGDEQRCRTLGDLARSAVEPLRGATRRTVARLVSWRLWADS